MTTGSWDSTIFMGFAFDVLMEPVSDFFIIWNTFQDTGIMLSTCPLSPLGNVSICELATHLPVKVQKIS